MKVFFQEFKEKNDIVFKFTAIQVSVSFLWGISNVSQGLYHLGFRQVASAHESFHTRSNNFPRRSLDTYTCTCIIIFVVFALLLALLSALLQLWPQQLPPRVLVTEKKSLHLEKLQKWRRLQFGARFLFCMSVFSNIFLLDISSICCAVRALIYFE